MAGMTRKELLTTYRDLAYKIMEGGKTGIVCKQFVTSKYIFNELVRFLNTKLKIVRNTDLYEISGEKWKLSSIFPSDRICGYQFDNLIYDRIDEDKIENIILSMFNIRKDTSWIYRLDGAWNPIKWNDYDPMVGSGTTLKMAKKLKRNFIGCDCSREYCDLAEGRLLLV